MKLKDLLEGWGAERQQTEREANQKEWQTYYNSVGYSKWHGGEVPDKLKLALYFNFNGWKASAAKKEAEDVLAKSEKEGISVADAMKYPKQFKEFVEKHLSVVATNYKKSYGIE